MTLIDNFKTDTLEVTRQGIGTYVEGIYQDVILPVFNMDASVQTMKPHEMINLPEAQRTKEAIWIFSDSQLFTVNEKTKIKADRVLWRGDDYEIQKVEDWTKTDLPHFKSIGIRVDNLEQNRKVI